MTANTRAFKTIFAAFVFLVTWQEYELKPHLDFRGWPSEPYTVETVDKSIRLKTQKDVDLFVDGVENRMDLSDPKTRHIGGLLPASAFNIKVSEVKE